MQTNGTAEVNNFQFGFIGNLLCIFSVQKVWEKVAFM